ncbi:MAG TPA: hypothetical protein VGQ02_02990, partial [Candidatus Limnocylindrales bacterium]|nr:hypothetical protein [Candidatus Limnocylindrales bacterium]
MKSTKAAKDQRRARRISKRNRRRPGDLTLTTLGPGTLEPGLAEQILAAFRGFDPSGPWSAIAPRIVPVLKRRRHPYPPEAAPLHIHVPPGIWTGFGIDVGPAFSHVSQTLLDGWGIDHATLLATALDNLAGLVRSEPPVVESLHIGGVDVTAIQGQGWGSSLVLAPDLLRPLLDPTPRVLLAPVRNTLLALPDDVAAELAFELWDAITEGAHDELEVDPLRWTGSTVTLLADSSTVGLPN